MLQSHLGCRAGTCALGHRWAGVRALTATSPQQPHSLPYEGHPTLSPRTLEIPAGWRCVCLPPQPPLQWSRAAPRGRCVGVRELESPAATR